MTQTSRKSSARMIRFGLLLSSLALGACGGGGAAQSGGAESPASAPAASTEAPMGKVEASNLVPIDTLPSELIDLTNWKLTLPFGEAHHPTEIKQPDLQNFKKDGYFYSTAEGVVFHAHVSGVTTPNSSYPRTELREMTGGGRHRAAWSSTKGRHTMVFRAAITGVPIAKPHVVAGQVHDAKDDVVMIRLERDHLFVEGGGNNLGTLTRGYELGTEFKVILDVSDGHVRVYYNDEPEPRVDVVREVAGCYFKMGAYTQSNPTKGDEDDAYGEVIVKELTVHHQE